VPASHAGGRRRGRSGPSRSAGMEPYLAARVI
jgi:hypothetical protein